MNARHTITQLFKELDIVNGRDIVVHDDRFYEKVLRQQTRGLGESYVNGWWDTPDITKLIITVIRGLPQIRKHLKINLSLIFSQFAGSFYNRQAKQRNARDVQAHYDIGNELYEIMLDKNMVYSCAYFQDPLWTLEQAQEAKIDLVYRKLHIPNQGIGTDPVRVLDIGCGWGFGLIHGARYYNIEGVGLTLSQNQFESGQRLTKKLPVEIRLQDYRDLPDEEKFDAIFSIGMFEHVGRKNYSQLMHVVEKHLKPNGLFLLHTIGTAKPGPLEPWMNKYIFPGAYLPSRTLISESTEKLFVLQDFQNFGLHYARTLEEWYQRFMKGWPILRDLRPELYTDRFFRMWKYYLLSSAAGFYTGRNDLWQFVFSKQPLDHVYQAVRNVRLQSEAFDSVSRKL